MVGGVADGGVRRGEVVVVGRAEIDTRAPFRSVKEAVVLFGERVLAGELSAGRQLSVVNQNRAVATRSNHHAVNITAGAVTTATPRPVPPPVTAELAVAKQELEKEREEKQKMAGCIQSLQEELSHAMRELQMLKARDDEEAGAAATAKVIDLEIDEGLSFTEAEKKPAQPRRSADGVTATAAGGELQKKRYVTFADPPTAAACRAPPLPDVVMELHRVPPQPQPQPQPHYYREPRFQRQMSAGHETAKAMAAEEGRKKKKKPLIPLVGALFMRRKKSSGSCHNDMF